MYGDVALTYIRALNYIEVTFLLMRDKCKITNVQQTQSILYNYDGLFVNFPVVITAKSCLKFRSINLNITSRIMAP